MLADERDEGLHGARQAAITPVTKTKLTPQVDPFHAEQLDFTSLDLVARETFADKGNTGVGRDEALDHADARQLHADANVRAIRAKELVEHLAREPCTRENQRLSGDFFEGDFGAMRERIAGADHKAQAVPIDVVRFQIGGFDRHGDNADVRGSVFEALQNLVAEIAINADVHVRVTALKFGKNIWQKI